VTGDASYLRMLWKQQYQDHLDGDCGCPLCSPPICESCGVPVIEEGDYCRECLEATATAEREWRSDYEEAA